MHFDGLSQMLRLRGETYDAFSHNKTLQKIISWYAIIPNTLAVVGTDR